MKLKFNTFILFTRNIIKHKFLQIALTLFLLIFISCSPVANIDVNGEGSVSIDLTVTPSSISEGLIKNLSGGNSTQTSLYDKDMIVNSLTQQGITVNRFTPSSFAGLKTNLTIPKKRVAQSELFVVDTEKKYIACNLNRKTLNKLFSTLPDEVQDYVDLLLSPITTNEEMTMPEYENLISSAYGPKITNELQTSFFKITVSCPGIVDSVRTEPKGKVRYFTGNSATITVPLSYVLSLEKPLLISITYK